jgi:hypothetical protein
MIFFWAHFKKMLALFVTQVWLPEISLLYLYKKLKQISSYEHIIIEPNDKYMSVAICNQLLSEARKASTLVDIIRHQWSIPMLVGHGGSLYIFNTRGYYTGY